MGEPAVGGDELCGTEFGSWSLVGGANFAFESAGVALPFGRADTQLVALSAHTESPLGKRVCSRSVQSMVGGLQVPANLQSHRTVARNVVEARYMVRLNAYVRGGLGRPAKYLTGILVFGLRFASQRG